MVLKYYQIPEMLKSTSQYDALLDCPVYRMPDSNTDVEFRGIHRINITVQSGIMLKKEDLTWMIKLTPDSWLNEINKIVVHSSVTSRVLTSYYRPNKTLGIHVPHVYSGSTHHLFSGIAVTIQAISEYGYIPQNIPFPKIQKYLRLWEQISTPQRINRP